MYNLLVVYREGTWNEREYTLSSDRFLSYTVEPIASRLKSLDAAAVAELMQIPSLFAYEERGEHDERLDARIGWITSISHRKSGIAISWKLDNSLPAISQATLAELCSSLDIDRGGRRSWRELTTTHWAVKDVDLYAVLQEANIAPRPVAAQPPRVFISYSWDSADHQAWVLQLSIDLRERGIDAILDQTHLRPGQNLVMFMEDSTNKSDRVIVVCTPEYMRKAADRKGGAGYEHNVTATDILANPESLKYIPILRNPKDQAAMPVALRGRMYLDFSDGNYAASLDRLVRELHNADIGPIALGPAPNFYSPQSVYRGQVGAILNHDRTLFAEFQATLPFEPTIRTLRDTDFGTDYRTEWLAPLDRFVREWDDPNREFLDAQLEVQRKELYDAARELAMVFATETVPHDRNEGWRTVFPWNLRGGPRPDHVLESARTLNQHARAFIPLYERFIRLARTYLNGTD
jgi:hypothetical protein